MPETGTKGGLLKDCVAYIKEQAGDALKAITVERAVFGLFFTGVKLSTGHGGLCFTPIKDMPQAVCCPSSARAMPYAGRLAGIPAEKCIDGIFDDNPLKKAMGIAALNTLSAKIMEQRGDQYEIGNAFDVLEITEGTKAVVVGALVPAMRMLRQAGASWTVLEMDPRTLKGDELDHYLPPEQAAEVVPDADLLIITGVTILNDTLEGLLKLSKPGAQVLVTGPTASMLPDVLFDYGVTMTGGIIVIDAERTLNLISEGGSGYHFFGKTAEQIIMRKK